MIGPHKVEPKSLADYLQVMSRSIFSSGISWRVVQAKWDGIRTAFHGFEPEKVASLTPDEIEAIATDPRVIRNRRKIEAIVSNAEVMLELDRRPGGFVGYLRSHKGYEETVADLKERFRFLGDSSAYYFLYVVGEPVPDHEEWAQAHRRPLSA